MRDARFFVIAIILAAVLLRVHAAEPLDRLKLVAIDAEINQTIAEQKTPGAVLWIEHGNDRYWKAYGERAVAPALEPMTKDTIFDLASLTKVVATTPAIMLLIERGKVKLDEPAATYIPEFKQNGKETITVRHLLTHVSGLAPDVSLSSAWSGYQKGIELACAEKPINPAGTFFRYSDINFIVLGEIVHRVSGEPLDVFTKKEIYEPLQMRETCFLPHQSDRIAPTELTEGSYLRGQVHDPTARRMGGVAGHAGLFSTAADLARYARMMINGGELDGTRLFKPATVRLMTTVQSPEKVEARRGLGWDIDSGYSRPRGDIFPIGSYGHTGFTGTSLWIDPFSTTFWVFLSNRVHPDGKGNVLPLQKTLGTLVAESVTDFNFAAVVGALPPVEGASGPTQVLNGIDVLARQGFAPLKGKRVGLITNHTGKNRLRQPTIDLLRTNRDFQLKVLFSPEHGLYGSKDENVSDSVDPHTGLPVFSLYGTNRAPTAEQLKLIDVLVFDIQDVGCRFYTYTATMGLAMEAAAKAGVRFVLLDRVDPINGVAIDGPVLGGKPSFVAFHPVPLRYGMTLGELARMYKDEKKLTVDLVVVPVEGWRRSQWFDETGLPWINPSPNMRSLTEAIFYPGVGVLEMMNLSVGRGTGTPFELVGAPYIDDVRLAAELNKTHLRRARFVPVRFTPTDSKFKGKECGGVSILLTDRERCEVVDIGITIAKVLYRLYPRDVDIDKLDRLLADKATLDAIKADKPLGEIRKLWTPGLEEFRKRRARYLLYK